MYISSSTIRWWRFDDSRTEFLGSAEDVTMYMIYLYL